MYVTWRTNYSMYYTISQGYESHTENTVWGCQQSDCLTCWHTHSCTLFNPVHTHACHHSVDSRPQNHSSWTSPAHISGGRRSSGTGRGAGGLVSTGRGPGQPKETSQIDWELEGGEGVTWEVINKVTNTEHNKHNVLITMCDLDYGSCVLPKHWKTVPNWLVCVWTVWTSLTNKDTHII